MNTCENAWIRLQLKYGQPKTAFQIQIKRKIAAAGSFSDGTRVLTLEPCPSFRWIMAKDGAGRIMAEVDQREHMDDPDAMNADLAAQIDGLTLKALATEQTPEGLQTLAPGVEPVTQREKLEKQMDAPKQGNNAPCNRGLFDMGARDQLSMFG